MESNNLLSLAYAFIFLPFFVNAMEPAVLTMYAEKPANAASLVKPEENSKGWGDRFDNGLMCTCGPCFKSGDFVSKKISKCYTGTEIPLSGACRSYALTNCLIAIPCICVKGFLLTLSGNPRHGDDILFNDMQLFATHITGAACISCLARRLEHFQARQNQAPERAVAMETTTNTDDSKTE